MTPGGHNCVNVSFAGNRSEVKVGWSAGAGISKAFAGNWNVGVEYLHIDLGRSSVTGFSTIASFPTSSVTQSQRFTEDTVRLTLNYKFGGQAVARY